MLKHFRSWPRPGNLMKIAIFVALLLTAAVVLLWSAAYNKEEETAQEVPATPYQFPAGGPRISVLLADGSVTEFDLEEFLVGVLAAEMPANFAPEALKAQAIAARTYIISHLAPYGRARHAEADICTDSTHCQAYADLAALEARWGANFDANYQAVCRAVSETVGQVALYEGLPVETVYCSTCGGRTEAAVDVWGRDVAYLQSVACPWDGHAPRYASAVVLGLGEAAAALGVDASALRNMVASYTAGGAVASVSVGGKQLSGAELRQALGLNSANASWLVDDQTVLISTLGYGHGVGLCQYGADGMAQAGYTAQEIICYYYQGVEVQTLY